MRRATASSTIAGVLVALTATAAQAAPGCDDHLVTHRPTSSSGDATAVAITSQAIDRDAPGWTHAAWESEAETTVREVLVERTAGTVRLAGSPTGSVEDALSLTFCGTVAGGAEHQANTAFDDASALAETAPEPAGDATAAAPATPLANADPAPPTEPAPTPEPATTSPTTPDEATPATGSSAATSGAERSDPAAATTGATANGDDTTPAAPGPVDPRTTAAWQRANLDPTATTGTPAPAGDAAPTVALAAASPETDGAPVLPGVAIGIVLAAVVLLVSRGNRAGVTS